MTPRRHQREALEALDAAWRSGRTRAWVELPPGAGKTLVGLESGRRMQAAGLVERVVVLSPNTAIQGQWVGAAGSVGLVAGDDRSLTAQLTSLTYQSVAVFDPESEVDEDANEAIQAGHDAHAGSLLERLHDRGRELVDALREAGRILLVLDECHHLLEVWGQLLREVLDELPEAVVLGLTATPPESVAADQAELVAELFGESVYETSIPAVVREGDLAPFAELAWLTAPTPTEEDWLAGQAERFTTLTTRLTDPEFGSVPFLTWLDRRFVEPVGTTLTWTELLRRWPAECAAALRMHHAGLLALPAGVRPGEEHRRPPSAEDWVVLLEDWLLRQVVRSEDPRDQGVLEEVRAALPAVGYQWTRRGVRRGRSTVDRVLARSESKAQACVEIIGQEHRAVGDALRMLVLCDHERASATLPVSLEGVLDVQAGSAYAVLRALLDDDTTAALHPVLVTGRTVAGASGTLAALRDEIAAADARLASGLEVVEDPAMPGLARLEGSWTSRRWVPLITRFFEAGGCRVLVGTRALLGEGWDARRISGLVDLTAVTTSTAVVQTRGRALRIDPARPEKVAVNWTVACITDRHPGGDRDWSRLVRKHDGYFAPDADGDIVDGVAHLDPLFSPFAPPPADAVETHNARAVVHAEARDRIREQWRIGEAYDDRRSRSLRVLPGEAALGTRTSPASVVVAPTGLSLRADRSGPDLSLARNLAIGAGAAALVGVVGAALVGWPLLLLLLVAAVGGLFAGRERDRARRRHGVALIAEAQQPPSLTQVAGAVADALHATGQVSAGSEQVSVEPDSDGDYRCHLDGVPEPESMLFAEALDEAMAPIGLPRYVLPRYVVTGARSPERERAAARGTLAADGEVWHPVPGALGGNVRLAQAYAAAFDRWIGCGPPVYTGSPAGAGILAAQQGSDPFQVSTVMRREWR